MQNVLGVTGVENLDREVLREPRAHLVDLRDGDCKAISLGRVFCEEILVITFGPTMCTEHRILNGHRVLFSLFNLYRLNRRANRETYSEDSELILLLGKPDFSEFYFPIRPNTSFCLLSPR